jgi:hypothetical protein
VLIDQHRIDLFAEATDDHQWIHVDAARAAAGPFGATIAHGFLTLSLLPMLMERALVIEDVRMGVNYGLNRVRFTSPVPVGSHLRGRFRLQSDQPWRAARSSWWRPRWSCAAPAARPAWPSPSPAATPEPGCRCAAHACPACTRPERAGAVFRHARSRGPMQAVPGAQQSGRN